MLRAVLAMVVSSVACGSQSKHAVPPADDPTTLLAGSAVRYNDPIEAPPPSEVGDAVIAATRQLAQQLQKPLPVADARLSRAARALARVYPADGAIASGAVEFALESNGVIEPAPHLLLVRGDLQDPQGIVDTVRAEIGHILEGEPIARIGVGTWDGRKGGKAIIALQPSHLETSPIPRSVPAGAHVSFDLDLGAGYRDPEIHIARPNGETAAVPVQVQAHGFHADIDCGGVAGRVEVEVRGVGPEGGDTLARFPVWCGAAPPASLVVGRESNDLPATPHDAEQRVFVLLNTERELAGLAPLIWDEQLAQVARTHSEQMRSLGTISNDLPVSGDVQLFLRSLRHDEKVFVSVARAHGVAEVHAEFLGAPSIRAALMAASTTRAGVGIAYGREVSGGLREIFVTEVLSAPSRQ